MIRAAPFINTAMVMAAGHGTRMRPLTNDRPKALVEVGGRALIDHMLDRLRDAGVRRAVVNVHAFADRLEHHLSSRTDLEIIISDEREALLETGGGLVKALPLLGDDPIFIANIDAIWVEWGATLPAMIEAWNPDAMDELFLLADRDHCLGYAGAGDFDRSSKGLHRRSRNTAPYVYAGVEIFKPSLAKNYAVKPFSRNKIWDVTLAENRVQGLVLPGYWMHVGDPRARLAAEAVLDAAKV